MSPTPNPAPQTLTQNEKQVLEFVEKFIQKKGIAPSYQEICSHFGFASINSAQRYLKQLEQKGYIHLPGQNQKRAIQILQPASAFKTALEEVHKEYSSDQARALQIPMLGRVAAGAPIEEYEHDEYIDVPASLVRAPDRTYALKVKGQSMIEDGIFEGDVILVQRQANAQNGQIVVAVVDTEATVKRFYKHDKKQRGIELRPANSTMKSMWFQAHDVHIRGIVVGLIRKFT